MKMKYKFYMKREGVDSDYIDLESYFLGMKYMKCEGLNDKGKVKNRYTETYSDSDTLRVYMPDVVAREATTITLRFAFLGENNQQIFDLFYNFVKGNKIYYYDTARGKEAYMFLQEAVTVSEDVNKDGTKYIVVDFKFQNMSGECLNKNEMALVLTVTPTSAILGSGFLFDVKFYGQNVTDCEIYVDDKLVLTSSGRYAPNTIGSHIAYAIYNGYQSNEVTFNVIDPDTPIS